MGLFDFLKGAGKKIPRDADTGAELQKTVSAMGLDIKDLHVAFQGGTATVRGEAATQKDLELARLVVGNHEGVEKVNDDNLKVVARAAMSSAAAAGPGANAGAPTVADASYARQAEQAADPSRVGASAAGAQAPVAQQAMQQMQVSQGARAGASTSPGLMYTVKAGDTLSKIAKETMGDSGKYNRIFEANRPMIKDADEIYPGQVLRIPQGNELSN